MKKYTAPKIELETFCPNDIIASSSEAIFTSNAPGGLNPPEAFTTIVTIATDREWSNLY